MRSRREKSFSVVSIAWAPREALTGRFIDTSWKDFCDSLHISTYSLIEVSRFAEEMLVKKKGSILTMTYLGSVRTVPMYNVMGVAKAALEASMRYLAADLGSQGVRVNGLSAGPIRTLASAGVPKFSEMYRSFAEKNPLKLQLLAPDVADVANIVIVMFQNPFLEWCCPGEADITSDGQIDIEDIATLVRHLFIDKPVLEACP